MFFVRLLRIIMIMILGYLSFDLLRKLYTLNNHPVKPYTDTLFIPPDPLHLPYSRHSTANIVQHLDLHCKHRQHSYIKPNTQSNSCFIREGAYEQFCFSFRDDKTVGATCLPPVQISEHKPEECQVDFINQRFGDSPDVTYPNCKKGAKNAMDGDDRYWVAEIYKNIVDEKPSNIEERSRYEFKII